MKGLWSGRLGIGRRGYAASLGGIAAAALMVSAAPAAAAPCASVEQQGNTVTVTCAYTGAVQTWTVPANVSQATFTVAGAQGGSDYTGDEGIGGRGGMARATLALTPGTTLSITVGGRGGDDFCGRTACTVDGAGGFGGGGSGGASSQFGANAGGGGGGSFVGLSDGTFLIVAGGGGGSTAEPCANTARLDGGVGGGASGGDGQAGCGSGAGRGGTQTAGGAGGSGEHPIAGFSGEAGSFGQGGDGASLSGGGGGGWYGGGGGGSSIKFSDYSGTGTGGGGGSGHLATDDPRFVSGEFLDTTRGGDGVVTITYDLAKPTTLTYDGATTGQYGAPATLSATLTDRGTSAPLAGRSVSIGFGAESCTATTDQAGKAACQVTPLDSPAGSPYPITASFAGDGQYAASVDTSAAFVVTRVPTRLTYDGATTGQYGAPATLSATLTDRGTSAPLAGRSVSIGFGAESCTATTDQAGKAACQVTPLDSPAGSPYPITASFAGDGQYAASVDTSAAFVVTRVRTTLVAAPPRFSGLGPVVYSATLTQTADRAPIAGRTITFTQGGRTTCTATTDAAGTASCSSAGSVLTLLLTLTSGGTYEARFAGDERYLPSQGTARLF